MAEFLNISDWEKQLKEDFSQFNPEPPPELWQNLEESLEKINGESSLDQGLRDRFDAFQPEVPKEVWTSLESQLGQMVGSAVPAGGVTVLAKSIIVAASLAITAATAWWIWDKNAIDSKDAEILETTGNKKNVLTGENEIDTEAPRNRQGIESGNDLPEDIKLSENEKNPLFGGNRQALAEPAQKTGNKTPGVVEKSGANAENQPPMGGGNANSGSMPDKTPTTGINRKPTLIWSHKGGDICEGAYITLTVKGEYSRILLVDNKRPLSISPNLLKHDGEHRFTLSGAGEHHLMAIIDFSGQQDTQNMVFMVREKPKAEIVFNILENPTYELSLNSGEELEQYNWWIDGKQMSHQNYFRHTFYDFQPTQHRIKAVIQGISGCTDTLNRDLFNNYVTTLKNPDVRNVLAPGGEPDNRELYVAINACTHYELYIFNSKKELVFESFDLNKRWGGTNAFTGLECPAGTYLVMIRYAQANGEVKERIRKADLIR